MKAIGRLANERLTKPAHAESASAAVWVAQGRAERTSEAPAAAGRATDEKDRLYGKANRGDYICIAAPGVDIIAPALKGGYDLSSGTSMAAAHVSGVVALLLERDGKLDWSGAREILSSSARKPDASNAAEAFGAGILDAANALGAGR